MKVSIYAGTIPSTTFIDRLIYGLADHGLKIHLHGRINGEFKAHKNICIVGYKGRLSKIILILKYGLLLTASRQGLKPLLNRLRKINGLGAKFNFFVKAAPVIYFKPDVFHLQWASDIENWIFLQQYGIKVVCSLRGRLIDSAPLADLSLRQRYLNCFPAVDAFHAVSNAIANESLKYGAPGERVFTVYSGLKLEDFPFKARSARPSGNLSILSVGRANWKKGYCHALDACALLQKAGIGFTYKIVGGADEEIFFQISDLGLEEKVAVTGPVDFKTVSREMENADILLLPSLEEGIANVVLEAMAKGLPVLSTDCGGMPEVVIDGVTGWLVKTRRPDQIAHALIRFMNTPVSEKQAIISNARKRIEQYHTEETMIRGMMNVYSRCLHQT